MRNTDDSIYALIKPEMCPLALITGNLVFLTSIQVLKVSFEPFGEVTSDKDLIFVKYTAVWILLCVRTSFT